MKQFERVEMKQPDSSIFDNSHELKTTMNFGDLVPILTMECLPGDKHKITPEVFLRLMPMVFPTMHRVNLHIHAFWVPYRLIWSDFENFITGGKSGELQVNHPKVTMQHSQLNTAALFGNGSLSDYLGLPVNKINASLNENFPSFSQLPFRAYQKIYNDYYRDQDISDEINQYTDSVDVTNSNVTARSDLFKKRFRAWEKDYFTSCRPTAQRGEDLTIPLLGSGEFGNNTLHLHKTGGSVNADEGALAVDGSGDVIDSASEEIKIANTVDLTTGSILLSAMRLTYAIQRWMEKSMRGGWRYYEQLRSFWGVDNDDMVKMDRPQYLGGQKIPVKISDIMQTAEGQDNPIGQPFGYGIVADQVDTIEHYAQEHGLIMIVASILPRTAYSEGLHRMWSRFDKFDFPLPEFSHIGEQAVLNKELSIDNVNGTDDDLTFGYQDRNSEFKNQFDRISADMRSSLADYHLGRQNITPSLNHEFIHTIDEGDVDYTELHRIFAVTGDERPVIAQVYFDIMSVRKLPEFSTPI